MPDHTPYAFNVNVQVDDDTSAVAAYVFSGTGKTFYGRAEAAEFDVALATRIGALILQAVYREHFTPEPADEDEFEQLAALKAVLNA